MAILDGIEYTKKCKSSNLRTNSKQKLSVFVYFMYIRASKERLKIIASGLFS